MDVRLPDLNGIQVVRTLRTEFLTVRVVVITAHDQPELRSAAEAAGADGFLPKDNLFELPALLAHWNTMPATPLAPREEG
jgi:DNA-binding NarL/FixJ family response regulator